MTIDLILGSVILSFCFDVAPLIILLIYLKDDLCSTVILKCDSKNMIIINS